MATPRKIAQPSTRKMREQAADRQNVAGLQREFQHETDSRDVEMTDVSNSAGGDGVGSSSSSTCAASRNNTTATTNGRGFEGSGNMRDTAAPVSKTITHDDDDEMDFAHNAQARRLAEQRGDRIAADPELVGMIMQDYAENMRARQQVQQHQQQQHQQHPDSV
ncbi:hypothetical protein PG994_000927 [Apiospora phragmitis]|uniref:Uncharacterized protein n=1 Tax=Apiospora phragmitis TaxID=2905665 RepID=A0ABR1WSD2_9PEZI